MIFKYRKTNRKTALTTEEEIMECGWLDESNCDETLIYINQADDAEVFVARPTQRASEAQGLFFGGSGRRAVAHTRPAFPKNAYGPVSIPLIRGASGAGQWTQPPQRE